MIPIYNSYKLSISAKSKLKLILLLSFLLPNIQLFSQTKPEPNYQAEFQAICDTVEKHFYQPEKVRTIFSALRKNYETQAKRVKSSKQFSFLVNNLLAELKTSHTHYYTRHDFEYYQLADIFYALPWIQELFEEDSVAYPSFGLLTQVIDNKRFVIGVLDGSEAEKAGIQKGDEIIGIKEVEWGRLDLLKEWIGKEVHLQVRKEANSSIQLIPLKPQLKNPQKEFLSAIRNSIKVEEIDGIKVGYIHMWSYAGRLFHDELEAAISWGELSKADVLIWDLRDGWGGASPNYLNIFNHQIPQLSFKDKDGNTRYFDSQWRKPVIMVTNDGSRSGKELLAYGFKKYQIGPIIGEKTAGAVVAGRLFVMPSGNLLYLAVNNAIVDGEILEGKGVTPTIQIPMKIPYLKGKDIQLEKAIEKAIELGKKD